MGRFRVAMDVRDRGSALLLLLEILACAELLHDAVADLSGKTPKGGASI
jgi:hypothetical protein